MSAYARNSEPLFLISQDGVPPLDLMEPSRAWFILATVQALRKIIL